MDINRTPAPAKMENHTAWTESDYEDMSWHDCHINSIALDQDEEWQNDLILDLDYIREWQCEFEKACRFQVAPAVLRFTDVDNLKLDVSLKFKQPMQIASIDRLDIPTTAVKQFRWIIKLQSCHSEEEDSLIKLDASGFVQKLVGNTVESSVQYLTAIQRRRLKEAWRMSSE